METMLTPTLAETKNTLCEMNSVMPFDNKPQTDGERRTWTYRSRLDSTSGPLGFLYGQHNLKKNGAHADLMKLSTRIQFNHPILCILDMIYGSG